MRRREMSTDTETESVVTEEDLNKPETPRTVGNERVHRLVDEITSLTILETADLSKLLKERLGLSDMPMMPMGGMMPMQAGGAGGAAAPAAEEAPKEEKTSFNVKLESFEAGAKIKVIKEVRALTSLGLKEAKELVEGAPKVLQEGLSKEDADALKEKFAAGSSSIHIFTYAHSLRALVLRARVLCQLRLIELDWSEGRGGGGGNRGISSGGDGLNIRVAGTCYTFRRMTSGKYMRFKECG